MVRSPAAGRLPRLLSVRDLSEATGIPASTLYDLLAGGDLPVVRLGRAVRVDEADAVAFFAARKERAR